MGRKEGRKEGDGGTIGDCRWILDWLGWSGCCCRARSGLFVSRLCLNLVWVWLGDVSIYIRPRPATGNFGMILRKSCLRFLFVWSN